MATSFCIFCYRSDQYLISALAKFKNFYIFLKLIGRFNSDSEHTLKKQMQVNQLEDLSLSKLLGCCEGCLVIINGFCDIYHQYKCLEMQLEWKLKKLVDIVKLANRVPSRISQVNKALQNEQPEDGKGLPDLNQNGKLKAVRSFRHCFSKQCRRRLGKSQPRVLLRMNSPKQSFHIEPNPVTDFPLIGVTKKSAPKIDELLVNLRSRKLNSQDSEIRNHETTNEPNVNANCEDDVLGDQDNLSENAMDDNDSSIHHDYDDDPLNCNDLCADDTLDEPNIIDPGQNIYFTDQLIQTKLEFPTAQAQIPQESATRIAQHSIPQLTSSLTIENVVARLPISVNHNKSLQCQICRKHFVSQDWLNTHIEKDHSKAWSKTQKPLNLKTEAGNQNDDTFLIKIRTEKVNTAPSPTTSPQQRYSLREKRSTVKYIDNHDTNNKDNDTNNDMEYTAENCPSSPSLVVSDSDTDNIKPNIKVKKSLPKNPQNKVEYTYCEICKKKTTTKFLEDHTKTWHDTTGLEENQLIRCKNKGCRAYFLTQEQFNFHQRNEHNKIFRCHFCHKRFQRKFLLGQHIQKVHKKSLYNPIKCLEDQQSKPNKFKCKFCVFETTSPTKLAIHETEHALPLTDEPSNSKLRRCPRCPYKYAKRMQRRYVVHHLRHHLNYLTGESEGACEMCSKGKAYVENTKQHFDKHHNTDLLDDPTQVFKCDECPSYYLKSFQLHRHKIRIHPALSCHDCEKTFKTKFSLNCHMKTQHKEHELNSDLPVPCDWPNCVKRFGTESELEHHKIYSHKRNPEEKKGSEICEICGKGYSSVGRLKFHMEKAHVEKNWVCSECGKVFKSKYNLQTHMEYHQGPESWKFECKECGKKCVDKWKLASHMNTHTKEKPWICQFCGEKYAHRHNWRNHLKGKHMEEEGVEEIVNSKLSQKKGVNYLSRKGTKKGDCVMAPSLK